MKASAWTAVSLVCLAALLALAGLSTYLVIQQKALRGDSHLLQQELASLRNDLSLYEGSLASGLAAALSEAADAQARSDARNAAELNSLQADLSKQIVAVQQATDLLRQDTNSLKQELAALERQADAASAALGSKLDQQAAELLATQARVEDTKGRLDTLGRELALGLAALGAQLDQQGAGLSAVQADIQTTQARLSLIDSALAQGLDTLDSRVQQDMHSLAVGIAELKTQTKALSEQAVRLLIDTPTLYNQVNRSIVQVKANTPAGVVTGSGFLYGADRLTVITADHVIKDATEILVETESGDSIVSEVTASSKDRDVAVLTLARAMFATPLELADSDSLVVGQPVMLVGSPLGEPGTVTTGIVSALHRTETYGDYTVHDIVQFDAAANRGNSGGPLLNAKGEVVGIAVAGVVPTSGSGINFAVPSNSIAVVLASVPG